MTVVNRKLLLFSPGIVCKNTSDDERLLFNPGNGYMQIVNETGKFILDRCNGTRTADEIITMVKDAYAHAAPDKLEKEVKSFLDDLKKGNWIKEVYA
ncbi:MAG: PqqD family protein [Candidatus Omnitrophota bacterium]|nr:MAG: PqqD family protein [Candidatus Omnitrophota bacterium]